MKIFKNEVGRPSNETIKRRRIIIISIVVVFLLLICGGVYYLLDKNKALLKTRYDVHKEALTATFYSKGLDYIEKKKISCVSFDGNGCKITLPKFNKKGRFNAFWSKDKKTTNKLKEIECYNDNLFYHVGDKVIIYKNTTFYPNFNSIYCYYGSIEDKYRNINVQKTQKINNVIIDFENGVKKTNQDKILKMLKSNKYPWLFVPAKVFYLTYDGYLKVSSDDTVGVTHAMDYEHGSSYSTIDIDETAQMYDENKSLYNAIYHEFAHALDSRYKYKTGGKKYLCETNSFNKFYKSVGSKLYVENGKKISKTEFFAAMVTNYIWHIKEKKTNYVFYGLKNNKTKLTSAELKKFEKILDSKLKEMGMSGSIINGKGSSVK